MSQSEDMNAIDQYMHTTSVKTSSAQSLLQNWQSWFGNLSWWDKNFTGSTYDEARKRRNDFNVANATTPAEAQAVQEVLASGMTTEQMQMDPSIAKPTPVHWSPKMPGQRPTLRRWAKNDPDFVKQWQRILAIDTDGKFGKDTEAATKRFQSLHGLPVTGVVDTATWAAGTQVTGQVPSVTPSPAASPAAAAPSGGFKGFTPSGSKKAPSSGGNVSPDSTGALAVIKKPIQKIQEAGIVQSITGLPTPVKVIGGGALLGTAYYFTMKYRKHGHF